MADEMNALEMATIDELIEELGKRCSHVLVAFERECKDDPDAHERHVAYRGGYLGAYGLAHFARARMDAVLLTGKRVETDNEE